MGYALHGGTIDVLTSGTFSLATKRDAEMDERGAWEPARGNCFVDAIGLVADSVGNAFLTSQQHDCVFKITRDGAISVLAGWPFRNSGPPPGGNLRPMALAGLAVDDRDRIFITDANNHRIYELDPLTKTIGVIVGERRGWVDGEKDSARLRAPGRLASAPNGGLYVEGPWLRHVDEEANIRTLPLVAVPESAREKPLFDLAGLAVARNRQVWVSLEWVDSLLEFQPDGHTTIWKLDENTSSLVACEAIGAVPNYNGPWKPEHLTFDVQGDLLIFDKKNHWLRRVSPTGTVTTVLGPFGGPLRLPDINGLVSDRDGTIFVSVPERHQVWAITPNGEVRPIIQDLRHPGPLAIGSDGQLMVIDNARRVLRLTASGEVEVLFEVPAPVVYDGVGGQARFDRPGRIAIAGDGRVFVLERHHHRMREVTPSGEVTTPVRGAGCWPGEIPPGADIADIAVDNAGGVFALDDLHGGIYRLNAGKWMKVARYQAFAPARSRDDFLGLEVTGDNQFIVADGYLHRVYLVSPKETTRLAGSVQGTWDDRGNQAQFAGICDVARNSTGEIIIADRYRAAIIDKTGNVVTAAGAPLGWSPEGHSYHQDFETLGVAPGPDHSLYAISTIDNIDGPTNRLVRLSLEQKANMPAPDVLAEMIEVFRFTGPAELVAISRKETIKHHFFRRWEFLLGMYLTEVITDKMRKFLRIGVNGYWLQTEGLGLDFDLPSPLPDINQAALRSKHSRLTAIRCDVGRTVKSMVLDSALDVPTAMTVTIAFEEGGEAILRSIGSFRRFSIATPEHEPPSDGVLHLSNWDQLVGLNLEGLHREGDHLILRGLGWQAAIRPVGSSHDPIALWDTQAKKPLVPGSLRGRSVTQLHAELGLLNGGRFATVRFTLDGTTEVVIGTTAGPVPVWLVTPVDVRSDTWWEVRGGI